MDIVPVSKLLSSCRLISVDESNLGRPEENKLLSASNTLSFVINPNSENVKQIDETRQLKIL